MLTYMKKLITSCQDCRLYLNIHHHHWRQLPVEVYKPLESWMNQNRLFCIKRKQTIDDFVAVTVSNLNLTPLASIKCLRQSNVEWWLECILTPPPTAYVCQSLICRRKNNYVCLVPYPFKTIMIRVIPSFAFFNISKLGIVLIVLGKHN